MIIFVVCAALKGSVFGETRLRETIPGGEWCVVVLRVTGAPVVLERCVEPPMCTRRLTLAVAHYRLYRNIYRPAVQKYIYYSNPSNLSPEQKCNVESD